MRDSMIYVEGAEVEYLKFSAGEQHVKLTNIKDYSNVEWEFENFEEFMYIAMIVDVLKRNKSNISLTMRYIPFARQDRATTSNQPFSLKIFCKLLKTLKIDELYVHDPHSEVFESLMKGSKFDVNIFTQLECYQDTVTDFEIQTGESFTFDCVIAPDSGAVNKAVEIAVFEKLPLVTATKKRNPLTGELSNPEIDFGDLKVSRAIIVDDICDGGYTFIQLADVIKQQFPDIVLDLYVTHGIFSRGKDELNKRFDKIYVYNDMSKEKTQ